MAWIETRYRKENGVETKSKLFYVYYRLNGKKQPPICAGPILKTAEDLKKQMEDRDIRSEHGLQIDQKMTLGEAKAKYVDNWKGKEATLIRYKWGLNILVEYFKEDRKITTILRDHVIDFRDSLCGDYDINGLRNIIKFCGTFFSYCVKRRILTHTPFFKILEEKQFRAKKVARFFTEQETREIIRLCHIGRPIPTDDLQNIVRIAVLTGMREEEIPVLKKSWIQNGFIKLPWEMTKNEEPRHIPIHEKYLMPILKSQMTSSDLLFPGWTKDRIRQAWKRCIAKGVRNGILHGRFRFHDLRHTFASNYLEGGGELPTAKVLLGHSSVTTTDIYSHIGNDHLKKEVNKMQNKFMEPEAPVFAVVE